MEIVIYIYIYKDCVLIFPYYSARYIKAERSISKIKKKTTLSSRQACFVISHSSGDFNDKNIHNHRLYTKKFT